MKKFLSMALVLVMLLSCAVIFTGCDEDPPESKFFTRDKQFTYSGTPITVEWESEEVRQQMLASDPMYYNEEAFVERNISVTNGAYYVFSTDGTGGTGRAGGGFTYEINDDELTLTFIDDGRVLHFSVVGTNQIVRRLPFSEHGLTSNSYFLISYFI